MGNHSKKGKVFLIGAGPGDEGLFTLKGVECLRRADVVIFDYLANEQLLDYCPEKCERIYVGKKAGSHTLTQDGINTLMVELAGKGRIVARLKGGDPFIFGRGGEEALELARNGIDFEIVPGITAATAVAAYAGIPLTHRRLSSSVALITGHQASDKTESSVDWQKVSHGADTLVIYMGVNNLASIVSELQRGGKPGTTPVALIRWGTTSTQQTLTGTLENILEVVEGNDFKPPGLIIVGEVVSLREEIQWFENRPLLGKRIIVTRSRKQASILSHTLKELGAGVVEFPTIDIRPKADLSGLDRVFKDLGSFDWIVFTSTNGVQIFFERLFDAGYDSRALSGIRIAVIGSETGAAVGSYGISPDLVPESFTSEAVVGAFKALKADYTGERILLPGSEIAREHIPKELSAMGAEVLCIPIYTNSRPDYSGDYLDEVFGETHDLVTFTSSSTVSNLVDILIHGGREKYIKKLRGASIGPVTSGTAAELEVPILVEANQHTIAGLSESILNFFKRES